MRSVVVGLLLGLSVFAGCGPGPGRPAGDGSVANPEDPVTMTPQPGSDLPDPDGGPQRVRPRPGMADVRPVPWEKARPTADGRSVRITYWSGVEPCNVLDHVEMDYSESKITIGLFEGHDPTAGDVACIELALQKVVRVRLDEAVAGRRIVDGAP